MKIIPAIVIVLVFSAVTLAVTGCDINIVDKRLTKEEVAQAFAQRDAMLKSMAEAIKNLQVECLKDMTKPPEEDNGPNKTK